MTIPDIRAGHFDAAGTQLNEVVASSIYTFNCTGTFSKMGLYIKGYGKPAAKIDGMNIFKLGPGDSGIGYAVYGESTNNCPGYKPVIGDSVTGGSNVKLLCLVNGALPNQPIVGNVKLVFYKIGEVAPGQIPTQPLAAFVLHKDGSQWQTPEAIIRLNPLNVESYACYINYITRDVTLGKVGMSELAKPGDTSRDREFSLPFYCTSNAKVSVTIPGPEYGTSDNKKGLVALSAPNSTDTATGIKIQLLMNNKPLPINQAVPVNMPAGGGQFNVPFTARYYRTGGPLKAGTADGRANYIITYE